LNNDDNNINKINTIFPFTSLLRAVPDDLIRANVWGREGGGGDYSGGVGGDTLLCTHQNDQIANT